MKCPRCGAKAVNNGSRNGKKQYYCKGPVRHYFRGDTPKIMEIKKALSVEAFREQYDNHYKIKQGIRKLIPGELVLHRDFKESLNLQGSPSSEVFDSEEFDKYKGKAPGGKIFWSHPETIKNLKEERLLR